MAVWTIDDVRGETGVAPEFTLALVADDVVTAWIARAAKRINADLWGDDAVEGGAYLTAHMMALAGLGPYLGQMHSGQVTQTTVGQVSVSYAAQQVIGGQPTLGLSRYGIMYAELHAAQCFGIAVL